MGRSPFVARPVRYGGSSMVRYKMAVDDEFA